MSEVLKAVEAVGQSFEVYKRASEKDRAALLDRIEQLEAANDRVGNTNGGKHNGFSREQNEYKATFLEFVRRPREPVVENRLSEAVHDLGKKDVSIGVSAAGGYALPHEVSSQIENRVRQLNPFRQICRVDQTSSQDYNALVSMGDGTSGWSSETGTRSATNSPTLRQRTPTAGELYALPTASNWALQDISFNVEQWLVNEVSDEFASQEATAIISGNGSNKPTGILASNPVSTSDDASPMRAAEAIQYVPLPAAASSPFTTTAPTIDQLIDLVATVKERYLMDSESVAFVMHRLTVAKLRKQKSSTGGDYLWAPAVAAGQPERLLGYPVFTCDAMPTVSANAFPVLFGNFRRGYLISNRTNFELIRNPYSTPGLTSFYVSKRVGGCLLNGDAIKAAKVALS